VVTDKSKNESAKAAALSGCNKLEGQVIHNPCRSLQS